MCTAVFLDLLANRQRKKKEDLKIYDPYFCAGGYTQNKLNRVRLT